MTEPVTVCDISRDWDDRTAALAGATFFDSAAWLEAFSAKTGEVRKLGFFRGRKFVAWLCLGLDEEPGLLHARVPFSASFGGLLMGPTPSLIAIDEAVRTLLDSLHQEAAGRPLHVTYVQRARYVSMHPQYELEEFALLKNGFSVQDVQLEYYVNLDNLHYSQTLRNELRKKHGLEFHAAQMSEFLVFRELIAQQQGKIKTLDDEELLLASERFGDRLRLSKATYEGQVVAMLLSDELTSECAVGRNWFQDKTYSHLGATAFIVSEWLNDLKRRNFARAGFGASARLTKDLIPGFIFFKERFGPCTSMRKTFILDSRVDSTQAGS